MQKQTLRALLVGIFVILMAGCSSSTPKPPEDLVWNAISIFQQASNPGATTDVAQLKQRYSLMLLGPSSGNIPNPATSSDCLPEELKTKQNINGISWIVEVREKSSTPVLMNLNISRWENTDGWVVRNIDNKAQCVYLR